jgi:RNA polymerase-binding transcription factor DksA
MAKTTKKAETAPEKKLTASETETYRNKLLALRARLRGDVSAMTEAALNQNRSETSGSLSSMPIHMADLGSDNYEQEQTLSFIQSESGTIDQIEDALGRIKEGTFGICETCGCRIPKARLNFLPYAANCVKCVNAAQEDKDN